MLVENVDAIYKKDLRVTDTGIRVTCLAGAGMEVFVAQAVNALRRINEALPRSSNSSEAASRRRRAGGFVLIFVQTSTSLRPFRGFRSRLVPDVVPHLLLALTSPVVRSEGAVSTASLDAYPEGAARKGPGRAYSQPTALDSTPSSC